MVTAPSIGLGQENINPELSFIEGKGASFFCKLSGEATDDLLKIMLLKKMAEAQSNIISGHTRVVNGELSEEITSLTSVRLPGIKIDYKDVRYNQKVYRCAYKVDER